MKPLVIPPAAQRDGDSIQMLSAWIAEQGQHCSIKIGFWQDNGHDETSAWGIFLADTIRHITQALDGYETAPIHNFSELSRYIFFYRRFSRCDAFSSERGF